MEPDTSTVVWWCLRWSAHWLANESRSFNISSGKMPLFSSGKKNPAELVKALHESLNIISKEQSGKKNEKVFFNLTALICINK